MKRRRRFEMRKAIRIALGSGVLAAGLAFAGAPSANAQVRVRGSFPLPHGRISVDIGDRGYGGFPVGGYVPYGYDVYEDPEYGYGFAYEDQWIACEPRGSQWVIIAEPVFYGGYRSYGYRNYGYRDYRYSRPYRNDRYGYSRDYRRYDGRNYRRDDRRSRDSRYGRNDRRYSDQDRRWRR
jgi:hypothetical protein